MALSQEDVRAIAEYARIGLEEDELREMTGYLNDAVQMLEPIKSHTDPDVAPTYHPIGDLVDVMRPDTIRAGLELEDALYNATATQGRYFRVPRILDGAAEGGDR